MIRVFSSKNASQNWVRIQIRPNLMPLRKQNTFRRTGFINSCVELGQWFEAFLQQNPYQLVCWLVVFGSVSHDVQIWPPWRRWRTCSVPLISETRAPGFCRWALLRWTPACSLVAVPLEGSREALPAQFGL